MRTLYIPKSGGGYIEHPAPDNTDDFHIIKVADDFVWRGHQVDACGRLVLPEVSVEKSDAWVDAQRQAAYRAEVDPLMAEAAIKRAMGLDAEADTLTASAIAARQEIQTRYAKS